MQHRREVAKQSEESSNFVMHCMVNLERHSLPAQAGLCGCSNRTCPVQCSRSHHLGFLVRTPKRVGLLVSATHRHALTRGRTHKVETQVASNNISHRLRMLTACDQELRVLQKKSCVLFAQCTDDHAVESAAQCGERTHYESLSVTGMGALSKCCGARSVRLLNNTSPSQVTKMHGA
jgi:hypothetical protein